MRKLLNTSFLLTAILMLAACVSEKPAQEILREMVTISATVPEDPQSKVSFDDDNGSDGLLLSWVAGDCLRVISGSQSERYDILDGFDAHEARFRGPDVEGSSYTILYPGEYESVAGAEAFDFDDQLQNGNGSKDHLRYLAVLEGVDTKENINFSSDWASTHGGTFRQNGVVKFVLTLPDEVTEPSKVTLTGLDRDIAVSIENVSLSGSNELIVYAVTPWENIEIPSGTNLVVTVANSDGLTWSRDFRVNGQTAIKAGKQSIFRITKGFHEDLFAGGTGTAGDPYLIAHAKHLFNMHEDGILVQGEKKYFKMINDVDMSAINQEWIPLNYDNPYSSEVDFNGDNHTIDKFTCTTTEGSGAGFFRVLFGSVHDVSFTNATIQNGASNPTGILASYGGYGGHPATVYNVHVQGTVNSTVNAKGAGGVGGMFGRVCALDLESSSADCDVTGAWRFVGGLFGYDTGTVIVRNCWTSGSVAAGQRAGGIAGGVLYAETAIINCYSLSSVTAGLNVGGISAHSTLDNNAEGAPPSLDPRNVYEKCIAWNKSVKTKTQDNSNHFSSGAIVGYVAPQSYLTDCMRRADLEFSDYDAELVLYDQENAAPGKPLQFHQVSGKTYNYPYHGKAAASGKTLSQVARDLGWDSDIWDFSGSVPTLTGAAIFADNTPVSGASNAPTSVNPLPGQGEIRPAPGNGWSVLPVVSGENDIMYYAFDGVESVSGKTQQIFVIDFDLSSTKYKLQFVYESPAVTNSEVFTKYNALASINCGYEISSIVYKYNGIGKSYMPNNVIANSNGVANWKNEGAFYFDGDCTVKMSFDGYGLSINEQRQFYTYGTSEWANVVTSAPMLINDWYPAGRYFCDPYPNTADPSSEQPGYHQRATHPRTAVALTEGNHLLFIVVDGRYDSSGFSIGMSAKQLTKFLVNNFNPQYALNLDGGGSSTMCVKPYGVVNYPCDNIQSKGLPHDHNGERARDSHLVIVPR